VDDVSLDTSRLKPARQPEPVSARFEGYDDALDLATCLECPLLRLWRSNVSNLFSSAVNFFDGWRSIPGTIPAASQEFLLSSTMANNVVPCSKAVKDFLLWSIRYDDMGASPSVRFGKAAEGVPLLHRLPHSISELQLLLTTTTGGPSRM